MSVRRRASGRVHYNYFRDYDPAIGRYVESDPWGLFGGSSTFAYVRGRPIRFSDRLGLAEDSISAAIESAIARGDIARLQGYLDAAGLSPAQEAAAQAGLKNILGRLTGNTKKLAEILGKKAKDVEKAIEQCKQAGLPRSGPIRNPNVQIDPISGEVFPEIADGGLGDSIGNILDYL